MAENPQTNGKRGSLKIKKSYADSTVPTVKFAVPPQHILQELGQNIIFKIYNGLRS